MIASTTSDLASAVVLNPIPVPGGEPPLRFLVQRSVVFVADRARGVLNTVETLFATPSGTKGMTALAVIALVEAGTLELGTTARSLLGEDLPLIGDDVTIEHLLAHRSGMGDYLNEDAVNDIGDYVMPVPVHQIATTEQFLPVLDGHETVSPAGQRFQYNNDRYVVLALLAERASDVDFALSPGRAGVIAVSVPLPETSRHGAATRQGVLLWQP